MTDTGLFTDLLNEALAGILTAIALAAIVLLIVTNPRGPGRP